MEKLKIHVCGTDIHVTQLGKLTTGMVGATASFSFSPEWNGLLKTAVFYGGIEKDVILTGDTVKIPPECIRTPGLTVGVYGHLADGTEVIPTVMSERIEVATGAKPSGDAQSGKLRLQRGAAAADGRHPEQLHIEVPDRLIALVFHNDLQRACSCRQCRKTQQEANRQHKQQPSADFSMFAHGSPSFFLFLSYINHCRLTLCISA